MHNITVYGNVSSHKLAYFTEFESDGIIPQCHRNGGAFFLPKIKVKS